MQKFNVFTLAIAFFFWNVIASVDLQAQDVNEESPATAAARLKKLSIEELMDVEVMAVSRKPETLTAAATAKS